MMEDKDTVGAAIAKARKAALQGGNTFDQQAKRLAEKQVRRNLTKIEEEEKRVLDTSSPIEFVAPDIRAQQIQSQLEEQSNNPLIGMQFICPELSKLIQFRPKQLIAIAAHSGKGKTSIAANIASSVQQQGKRILLFSTEEDAMSMYARIVRCQTGINMPDMADGVIPKDHRWEEGKAYISQLTPSIEVIDIGTKGDPRYVQTIDGFKHSWESAKPEQYDVILIDYYQKIAENTRVPGLKDHEVHQDLCRFLDAQKTILKNIPIIVMAQIRANKDDEAVDAEERLWGRKELYRVCTYFVEIIPKKRDYKGEWMIWKSRSNGTERWSKTVGFHKAFGTYVDLDAHFEQMRKAWMQHDLERDARFYGQIGDGGEK
jgi:replicative DNA helicase